MHNAGKQGSELQRKCDISLMGNVIHHIFLGLYCTNDSTIMNEVELSFINMGVEVLGIKVREIKEQAINDADDKAMVALFMSNYNSECTCEGVRLIKEYTDKYKGGIEYEQK